MRVWRRSRQLVFWDARECDARPAGPAESSALHNFARSGPTKEAHRRAMNRSGGLLHSEAGRLTSANGPRPATPGPPAPWGTHQGRGWGTHQGRDQGTLRGPIRGETRTPTNRWRRSGEPLGIAGSNSVTGRVRGPKSASARPGPCTRPRSADALTRRELPPGPTDTGVKGGSSSAAGAEAWDGQAAGRRLRGLQLDPGSGRMVPRTRVGRSALRAAAPAGRGCRRAVQQALILSWVARGCRSCC